MQRFAFPSLPQHQKIRRYIHLDRTILIINRQSSPIHRIPGSRTRKGDSLMILRNTIRPQHNRKPGRRKTRLTRRNSHLPRITPNTKISIIIADNLTNPTLTSTRQTQIQIPRPPLNSSTRKRSTQSNPQISRRRRGHRRLQPHTPRTDVLPHRSNRITRRIHQTQRNNRLRPHHNPPPGANNPDTNNTTNPTRPTATRHPKNLLTCNLLQNRRPPRQAQPAGRPTRIYGLQHIPNATPPPD